MPMLRRFRTSAPATVSYNFTDIATGVSKNIYYLTAISNGAGNVTWALTDFVEDSCEPNQIVAAASDVDYDLTPFTVPQDILGNAYIRWAGITTAGTHALIFQLRHWDGTTETDISAAITSENADTDGEINFTRIPITVPFHFGAGSQLRLTITNDIGDGNTISFGTSPTGQNITDGTDPGAALNGQTQFKLYVEFRPPL